VRPLRGRFNVLVCALTGGVAPGYITRALSGRFWFSASCCVFRGRCPRLHYPRPFRALLVLSLLLRFPGALPPATLPAPFQGAMGENSCFRLKSQQQPGGKV